MNQKEIQKAQERSELLGLKADSQTGALFGEYRSYQVIVLPYGPSGKPLISFSVSQGGQLPDVKTVKAAVKTTKALVGCTVQRFHVNYNVRGAMSGRKLNENIREALEAATQFLRTNGYTSCCQQCGLTGSAEPYLIAGNAELLCPTCFAAASESAGQAQQREAQKKENVVGGIVGALLGSLIGAIVIVILGQLGYVAALSGVVAAVCAIKGYELLGGRLSTKGIIISVVLMLLLIYVGNRADWAITVAGYFEVDFFTAFRAIPQLISQQVIESGSYYGNLALVYLFALLGAVPTIIVAVRNRKQAYVTCKMSAL